MKSYNGHRSWNAFNVALWMNNDPDWHADWCWMPKAITLNQAIRRLSSELKGIKTPDGANFNALSIRLAIQDQWEKAA